MDKNKTVYYKTTDPFETLLYMGDLEQDDYLEVSISSFENGRTLEHVEFIDEGVEKIHQLHLERIMEIGYLLHYICKYQCTYNSQHSRGYTRTKDLVFTLNTQKSEYTMIRENVPARKFVKSEI